MKIATQTGTKAKAFLKPEQLLKDIPVASGMTVADFGSGNGYYAAAAANLVGKRGQVFALDILEEALSQTATLAKLLGLRNVSTKQCDLEKFSGSDLPDTSCDLVIIASILHQVENRENLLREAYRVLKTGGKLVVVEWEPNALFGPPASQRISKEETSKLLERYSFRPERELAAGSFHYSLLYSK